MNLENLVAEAHTRLKLSQIHLELLQLRGVSEQQVLQYRLGITDGPLDLPGLEEGSGDSFVFPLTNARRQVRGIQTRKCDVSAKGYLDYLETKEEWVTFGLGEATPHVWTTRKVLVVEGSFDLFPLARVYPFTISLLTSSFSPIALRYLKRMASKVYLGLDNDMPGVRGSQEFVQKHGSFFQTVETISYPKPTLASGAKAKDPSDLYSVWAGPRLDQYLKSLIPPELGDVDACS